MIKMRDVEKYFESRAGRSYVLRQINIDVEEGDFVTFMGPSGAGKSTLLHILGMLDGAWNGEYYFFDQAVHELNNKKRTELHKKYIGFVFQSYHLLDNLTVYENLEIPLSYRNIKRSERQSMVPTRWIDSKSSARKISILTSFPEGNSNWSRWPVRSSSSPSLFWPMSRRGTFIAARAMRSWIFSRG